jgi:hypothetical protein
MKFDLETWFTFAVLVGLYAWSMVAIASMGAA